MTRLAAASCFLCAAFAWVPPLIDRPGLAALGLAFLALSVGRGFERRRRELPSLAGLDLDALTGARDADLDALDAERREALATY
jgi:hypothetical protein